MKLFVFVFGLLFSLSTFSQQSIIDSLQGLQAKEKNDSLKIVRYYDIAKKYASINEQEMDIAFKKGIQLAQTKKFYTLFQLGFNENALQYVLKGKTDKALEILFKVLSFETKNKITDEYARSYFIAANAYNIKKNYTEAIQFNKLAFNIYKQTNNILRLGNVSQNIGNVYYALVNFEEAIKYYYDAIDYYDKVNAYDAKAQIYMNLGVINVHLKNFDIAKGFYEKALETYKKTNNKQGELLTKYNLVALLHGQKKYQEAIAIAEEVLPLAKKLQNKKIETTTLSTLASCYERINDFTKADYYFKQLFKTLEEYHEDEVLLVAYNNYAMFLSGQNQIDNAIQYQQKAISIAKGEITFKKYLHSLYATLAAFYNEKKEYSLAFAYKDSQIIYKEYIINETSNNKILELQTKYETQQKENKIIVLSKSDSIKNLQILAQQAEINKNLYSISQQKLALAEDSILLYTQNETILQNKLDASLKEEKINTLKKEGLEKQLTFQLQQSSEKQKKQILYSLLIGTILVSTVVLFALYQRNKKKQAEEKATSQKILLASILDTEEKERSRIAKDLHDGIVQDLTAIKLDINSMIQQVPNELQQQLTKVLESVNTTSKEVREISYQMMPVTLRELGLINALTELLNRSLTKNNIHFDFNSFGINERLQEKIETTVYRICQELINNTIKHSKASNVSLLLQLKNNILQLTYEDDGIGFNSNTIKKGIGLNSLNSRIEMVKGSLEFDDAETNGTTAYIRIPL